MSDHKHEHNNHPTHRDSSSVTSLLFGLAVGAAVTYLFANKDGQKVRDVLLKEGKKILDEVSEKIQEFEEGEQPQSVKGQIEEKMEEVKEKVAEIEEMVEDVPEHIEKLQKKGRRFFFHRAHSRES